MKLKIFYLIIRENQQNVMRTNFLLSISHIFTKLPFKISLKFS